MKSWVGKAGVLLVAVLLIAFGLMAYTSYSDKKVFEDSSDHLQLTYKQVASNFKLFSSINWASLVDCDKALQQANAEGEKALKKQFKHYEELQQDWGYSEFFLFNKDNDFLTSTGRQDNASSIDGVFDEVFDTGEPVLTSYISSSNVRKVVFAQMLSKSVAIDGVTYNAVAVCYENEYIEGRIVGDIDNEQSDSYLVTSTGKIVLSLQDKTVFTEREANFFNFLSSGSGSFSRGSLDELRSDLSSGKEGAALYQYEGKSYYVVHQPLGSYGWSVIGVVMLRRLMVL